LKNCGKDTPFAANFQIMTREKRIHWLEIGRIERERGRKGDIRRGAHKKPQTKKYPQLKKTLKCVFFSVFICIFAASTENFVPPKIISIKEPE
jgi:hypothetical protein